MATSDGSQVVHRQDGSFSTVKSVSTGATAHGLGMSVGQPGKPLHGEGPSSSGPSSNRASARMSGKAKSLTSFNLRCHKTGSQFKVSVLKVKESQYSIGASSACTVMAVEAVSQVLHAMTTAQGSPANSRPFTCSADMLGAILQQGGRYCDAAHLTVPEVLNLRPDLEESGLFHAKRGQFVDVNPSEPYEGLVLGRELKQMHGRSFAAVVTAQQQSLALFFPVGSHEVFLFDSHSRQYPTTGHIGAAFYFFDSLVDACTYLSLLFPPADEMLNDGPAAADDHQLQLQLAHLSTGQADFFCLGALPGTNPVPPKRSQPHAASRSIQQKPPERPLGPKTSARLPHRGSKASASSSFFCAECSQHHSSPTCPVRDLERALEQLQQAEADRAQLIEIITASQRPDDGRQTTSGVLQERIAALEQHLADVKQALEIERERTAALTLRLDESNCQHGEALKQSEKLRAEILKLKRELSNLRRKRRESLNPPAAPPRPVWQTPSNHPRSDAARITQENADFALALRAQQQEKQSAQQLQADRDYVLREATIEARMDADFELARELQKQEDQSRRQVEADEEFAKTVAPVMCMMCCCEVDVDFTFEIQPCGHTCCTNCTKQYFEGQIRDRRIPVKCWDSVCNMDVTEAQLEFVVDDRSVELYYQLSRTPTADPHFRQCPAPDCTGYDLVNGPGDGDCTCQICGYHWCCHCQVNLASSQHAGISCQQYQQWKKDNDTGDEAMERLLRDGLSDKDGPNRLRRCPACQNPWMKDDQCMHVTCEKQGGGCGIHFCFRCAKYSSETADQIYQHQSTCPGYVPPSRARNK